VDGSALGVYLAWHGVWFSKLGTPVASSDWDNAELGQDDGGADGVRDFFRALDSESDVYTSAKGCTATLGNFAKATFQAIAETSSYLSPDQWKEEALTKTPIEFHTDHLQKNHTLASIREAQKNNAH
jgi:hypothetical protein